MKILRILMFILIGVFTMQLSNSSPFPYNPLEPIGIEKNGTFFDLFNSPNNESYKDFYINESGLLISNSMENIIAEQKVCFELNSLNYCLNELPLAWKNQTDNLTYAWLNGTYSTAVMDFQLKYSLNQTEPKIKVDLISKNKFILTSKINISYTHFNLSLDNSNGSETYIWADGNYYSLTTNQTITPINKTILIMGTKDNFISMSWNDTAIVEIKGKEVYLKFLNININPDQEITRTIFWIDPINSVTLNDPTTNIVEWSKTGWFWMNCTVAKSGGPDTPQYLYFEHNNTAATMKIIPVNTTSSTLNTSSTNPISSFSYDIMYSINVSTPNANNYQIMCRANNTAGTEKTSVVRKVTVLQTNVTLNMSSLNLGSIVQDSAPLMSSAIVFSNGTNNDVNISCLTGSCSTITTNFTQADLTDNQTKYAFFNCSTSTAGFFSANFTVNSTEYQNSTLSDTKQMNVSCSITETIPPDILIRNPSNNSVIANTTVQVNYTYSTDVNTIWYEFNSNNTNITITTGSNITFNDLAKTLHNISLYANDSSNNINSSFINFSVKSSLPIITITNPQNNTVIANTTVQVNYTYSTDVSVITYELDSNNTNISLTTGQNITFTNLAKTLHNISLFANDSSNNINSSFINFSVKSSLPIITIVNPTNNSVIANTTVQVNYTYSTDVNTIWYEFNSNNTNITITTGSNITFTGLSNAFYNISLYANDSANNINQSFINFSVNFNNVPKILNLTRMPNTAVYGTSYNFSVIYYDADNTNASYVNFTFQFANGTQKAFENMTLMNAINSSSTNWTLSYLINLSTGNESLGTHQYWINASDGTATASSNIYTMTLTEINPIITLISPSNNSANSTLTQVLTYNVTNFVNNIQNCSLIADGALDYLPKINPLIENITQNTSDGYIRYRNGAFLDARATDNGIDIGQRNNVNNYLWNRGYYKFNLTEIPANANITQANLHINLGAFSSNVSCDFILENITDFGVLDSSDWNIANTTMNLSWFTSGSGYKIHDVLTQVKDSFKAGNSSSFRLKGSYESANLNYCFAQPKTQESTNVPFLNITYQDANTNTTITKNIPQTFQKDFTSGLHNWSINCTDTSNNQNNSVVFNLSITTIDVTPPNIFIRNPANNSVIANTTVQVNYTYSTDVSVITYELDSNNTNISLTTGQNITFTNLAKTLHNISLYANDSSNNINSSFINFSIKSSNPRLVIFNPTNNTAYAAVTKLTLNFSATDSSLNIIWFEYD